MSRFVYALVALVISTGLASVANAQDPAPLAAAVGAAAAAQYGSNQSWQPGPGYNGTIDVRCASKDFRYQMCQVDTGQGSTVTIIRQNSDTRCIQGRNWGWNRAGVWVDQGCDATFRVQRRWTGGGGGGHGNGGWNPGPGWNTAIKLRCESQGYAYRMCQVDTGRGSRVFISQQISGTACVEGRTWGFNRAGVWVDKGCAAVFTVDRRWN